MTEFSNVRMRFYIEAYGADGEDFLGYYAADGDRALDALLKSLMADDAVHFLNVSVRYIRK